MTPIEKLSLVCGLPARDIERDMARAIKAGFDSEDENTRRLWRGLFGHTAPTPEEFVKRIAEKILLGEL